MSVVLNLTDWAYIQIGRVIVVPKTRAVVDDAALAEWQSRHPDKGANWIMVIKPKKPAKPKAKGKPDGADSPDGD